MDSIGNLNWLTLCLLFGAIQGLFLMLSLRAKVKKSHPANNYLLLLLGCLILSLILRLTYSEGYEIFMRYPHLTIAGDFVVFVIGPSLYVYVRKLLDPDFLLQKKHLLYLLPLLSFLLCFSYFLSMTREELLAIHFNGQIIPFYNILLSVGILHISYFAWKGIQVIYQYQERYRDQFANPAPISFLKLILGTIFSIVISWIPAHLFSIYPTYHGEASNLIYQISFLVLSFLIFTIAFYAIKEPAIFSAPIKAVKDKYRHSRLSPQASQQMKNQLLQYLEREKAYINPDLGLRELAESLAVNYVHLSQVINQELQLNFYDLINSYRVDAFLEKATSGAYTQYTLLAIALESGFKSKTSFYKAFKKNTGLTPRQYLQKIHPQMNSGF